MKKFKIDLILAIILTGVGINESVAQPLYKDMHRPQIHYSPKKGWMNDPNGMVFNKGTYHLFYQYYPDSTVWGPMHWGHATSKDMVRWQEQPIALFPDKLGYIFSGSAVVDSNNTSGFGKAGKPPLIAIFTYHDVVAERAKKVETQTQGIAYSLDDGKSWTKYDQNPVLKNPGIEDFRDPKVSWYKPGKKWIMTLAVKDHIEFYSSPNFKEWKLESSIGKDFGAHGGVWECPDLFTLEHNGKAIWVLIVNINPGGPNGGSATQYFLGDFNGSTFTPFSTEIKWLDYGPDEYAGITWANTGKRKIFFGWMSNWLYADVVPTAAWRSAMTIARELKLQKQGADYLVASEPVAELKSIQSKPIMVENMQVIKSVDLSKKLGKINIPCRLDLTIDKLSQFQVVLSNEKAEQVIIGYDQEKKQYFINRSMSGKVDFHKDFAATHTSPRLTGNEKMDVTLIIDVSSVELFADGGLTVMTEIFFPTVPYNKIEIQSTEVPVIKKLSYMNLKSIWE